jgi:protein transport protein SEC24
VTGHVQWDPPADVPLQSLPSSSKRRQYAAGQTHAYSGDPNIYVDHSSTAYPDAAPSSGQFYTPALTGDGGFATASSGTSPADYGRTTPYIQNADKLADQFAGMGIGSPPVPQTVNLFATTPDASALLAPPPAIRLANAHANADQRFHRPTLTAIPRTAALLTQSKLPLALVLEPHRSDAAVPFVDDGIIARCRRCRSYIHPFVTFVDGGRAWTCSMCELANALPDGFAGSRAELAHGVVDLVAPTEYMVRDPPPLSIVVVLDVSPQAVRSGMCGFVDLDKNDDLGMQGYPRPRPMRSSTAWNISYTLIDGRRSH